MKASFLTLLVHIQNLYLYLDWAVKECPCHPKTLVLFVKKTRETFSPSLASPPLLSPLPPSTPLLLPFSSFLTSPLSSFMIFQAFSWCYDSSLIRFPKEIFNLRMLKASSLWQYIHFVESFFLQVSKYFKLQNCNNMYTARMQIIHNSNVLSKAPAIHLSSLRWRPCKIIRA